MTTSHSWFDQDKFSRLVKKVGPKPAPGQLKPAPARVAREAPALAPKLTTPPVDSVPVSVPKPEAGPAIEIPAPPPSVTSTAPRPPAKVFIAPVPETKSPLASTARISLASRPPGELSEARALPTLPPRPAPLPVLKPIFQYDKPADRPPNPSEPEIEPPPGAVPSAGWDPPPPPEISPVAFKQEEEISSNPIQEQTPTTDAATAGVFGQTSEDLALAWERVAALNQDLSRVSIERDEARTEATVLREQIRTEAEDSSSQAESNTEISRLAQELDEARMIGSILREQLRQAEEGLKDRETLAAQNDEMSRAVEQRDNARREYANLREQYETLKQEYARLKGQSGAGRGDAEKQLEPLQQQLAEREEENAGLRIRAIGLEDVIETLKQELNTLHEQLNQARDEASVAQRGLNLSQKALQETREALREASEGSSMTKHSLENLKKENSTLVQQNMLLQAQHDQVSRELSAAKAKNASKG